ncbi:hypothetical protein O181_099682 [Austropuccinia psidii MF-1]|uniref:Tet-like 2OG-Fe(II) oxygenase domain-containing protein n=1 Tax=Austropuccinia psidii MF-1 TaxID=1389203 RepID=A0A9Q3JDR6_9BASI|nr:hypothetical protein [Austropuccinia psidii MF-1]
MPQLGHSNTAYKNFSSFSIDKKAANASWLKLPSTNTLPHPCVIIDETQKPHIPVCIYKITPFDVSSGHSQILKDLIITWMSLSQNRHEIKTNKHLLGGIMKGIGFCPGSDAGKSAAAQENHSLMEAAKLPNFSQLESTSANPKQESKSFSNVIVTKDGSFNKPHQDLNDLNAWTYGIFSFVSKKDFHPLPTVFTPSGHGLHFPKLKMEINFSKKPGIMEILWKKSTMVHYTTNPPPEIINHHEITHFGCYFQINHKLFNVGEKLLKMPPTAVNSRVNGYCERNMQDQKRTKKY